jgi:hypothetical protein
MADVEAMEASVDAEDDGEVIQDTGGASLELLNRVKALESAFFGWNASRNSPVNSPTSYCF